MKRLRYALPLLATCSLAWTVQAQAPTASEAFDTPEGLIHAIYEAVTFPAGQMPDWDYVRSMFIPEAVVVLRTSKEHATVFSVEGFVQDFITFIEHDEVMKTGFTEEVIKMKTMVFGDIAHLLVLYESSIPQKRPPTPGVDSFQLIRRDGRWWIASVINEKPTEAWPIPQALR